MPGVDVVTFLPALGASVALSFASVGLFTLIARRIGMLALPGPRQSHATPTPTGGGAGLVTAVVVASLFPTARGLMPEFWLEAIVPSLAILASVGWLDDRANVPWWLRLLVQFAVSFGLVTWLAIDAPHAVVAVLALVWVMNTYNFMDGSNGMAGAQGVFSGVALGGLFLHAGAPGHALASFVIAFACTGFLPWNLPSPRVFMGDAGSVPLGLALGALGVSGVAAGYVHPAVALLVLGVFLCDSTLTLLKRVFRGERWYTAHNKHVYQRLIAQGWSHGRVLALYQAVNVIVLLPGIVVGTMYPELAWPLSGALFLLMAAGWSAVSPRMGAAT